VLIRLDNIRYGYNEITNMETKAPEMLMDIGVERMGAKSIKVFFDTDKETALLLLSGSIRLHWDDHQEIASRNSLFDENPTVLHFPKNVHVKVDAVEESEILVQKTTNDRDFHPVLYRPKDCRSDIFGKDVWNDTARRLVRTVFDYNNAPYSNMVLGEVINFPGKWSSYIPHGHRQPEVYFYRFDREHGFGAGFIGDDVFKIVNNSALCIPGGPTHPQTAAPGYAMYYCWMIRHLKDDPWTTRVDDERYSWLLEKGVRIWPDK